MGKLSFIEKESKFNLKLLKKIGIWVFEIAVVIAFAGVLVFYLGQKTVNNGASMEPVIQNGQEVMINKLSYMFSEPDRYDLVVFRPNGNKNARYQIKRVIALPGETIQISGGAIYIDDKQLTDKRAGDAVADPGEAATAVKMKSDEYFVLGDNRNSSEDSRYADIGMVLFDEIEGRAWLIHEKGLKYSFIK